MKNKTKQPKLKAVKKTIGVGALASELGVHRQTIQYWLRKKWIPFNRDYRGWPVFTPDDVERIRQWRDSTVASPSVQRISEILEPLVQKEESARDLYWTFSQRFQMVEEVGEFFAEMAQEESTHAAAVRLLSELLRKSNELQALQKVVPQKEIHQMLTTLARYKRNADKASLREAFRMAVDVETMERRCWPEGMIKALQKVVPEAFEYLPKFLVDGEDEHIRLVDSYATRYGGK